jgi:hypothetical protein
MAVSRSFCLRRLAGGAGSRRRRLGHGELRLPLCDLCPAPSSTRPGRAASISQRTSPSFTSVPSRNAMFTTKAHPRAHLDLAHRLELARELLAVDDPRAIGWPRRRRRGGTNVGVTGMSTSGPREIIDHDQWNDPCRLRCWRIGGCIAHQGLDDQCLTRIASTRTAWSRAEDCPIVDAFSSPSVSTCGTPSLRPIRPGRGGLDETSF